MIHELMQILLKWKIEEFKSYKIVSKFYIWKSKVTLTLVDPKKI